MHDALGSTSNRVFRWHMLLEEYSPEIIYIKGIHNTVADAISRLDMDPTVKDLNLNNLMVEGGHSKKFRKVTGSQYHVMAMILTQLTFQEELDQMMSIKEVFASSSQKDNEMIYPLTIAEISAAQKEDKELKEYFSDSNPKRNSKYDLVVIGDERVVANGTRMVVPKPLRRCAVAWYHHYLQHPGHTRLEETIKATMYWPQMRELIRKHVKTCGKCQQGK